MAEQVEGARRVFSNGRYKPYRNHLIVNWGNTQQPNWTPLNTVLNHPSNVQSASNKTTCLTILHDAGVLIPNFATSQSVAEQLFQDTRRVYCRTLTRASEGRGIVVANNVESLVPAPLYTAGIDGKRKEYRVHVVNNTVIDIVQKRKMTNEKIEENGFEYSPTVRNHDKGWVFARDGISPPNSITTAAISAIQVMGLHFGAVDIVVRDNKQEDAIVLEINTAPGLEASTLEAYSDAFRNLL